MPDKLFWRFWNHRSLSATIGWGFGHKLSEIDGDEWLNGDDPLTDAEKALLEVRLAAYEREPDAGSSWEEVEGRIQSRIKEPDSPPSPPANGWGGSQP